MNTKVTVKTRIVVDGKEYHSLEELPAALRAAYEKAVASGAQVRQTSRIVFNGRTYDTPEAMPAEALRGRPRESAQAGCALPCVAPGRRRSHRAARGVTADSERASHRRSSAGLALLEVWAVALQQQADESTTGPASFVAVDPDGNTILVDQHV
jgi:hypothetical protein